MPAVSIIIPMYNVEAYIDKCMHSVLNQTMQDYEVIVIDDGSKDASYEKAVWYEKLYPTQVRVYRQKNAGQGDARNSGVLLAKGEYILFVDSDDTVADHFVEEAYKVAKREDADIVIFDAIVVDENNKKIEDLVGCHANGNSITLEEYPRLLLEYPCPWNKIYRRSLLVENHLKYPIHMWYEDLVGASMFYVNAKKIAILHKQLYYYMQRTDSVMHSKVSDKNIEILKAVDMILDYYREKNIDKKYHTELEYLGIYHILIAAAGRTVRGDAKSPFPEQFMRYMNEKFPAWEINPYIQELSKANRLKLWLLKKKQYKVLHILYRIGKTNTI